MLINRKRGLTLALAAAIGAAVPAVVSQNAFAQAAPPAAAPDQRAPRAERPSRIEGRLAFLKTELKVTDAQTPQWNAVADILRQQDKAMRDQARQMRENRGKTLNAVERLELRQKASESRLEQTKQFAAVFRPFYASLNDEQKKTADELFEHVGHHRGPPQHRRL